MFNMSFLMLGMAIAYIKGETAIFAKLSLPGSIFFGEVLVQPSSGNCPFLFQGHV